MSIVKIKSHPNFKSADPSVVTLGVLNEHMERAIKNQTLFVKKTTLDEKRLVNLENFFLNLTDIDRLFFSSNNKLAIQNEEQFHMIARLEKENLPLYIELAARYNPNNTYFDNAIDWDGFIFVSANVNTFMKLCLKKLKKNERKHIYTFIKKEDGIEINDDDINDDNDYYWEKIVGHYHQYYIAKKEQKKGSSIKKRKKEEKEEKIRRLYEEPFTTFLYIFNRCNHKSIEKRMKLAFENQTYFIRKTIDGNPLKTYIVNMANIDKVFYVFDNDVAIRRKKLHIDYNFFHMIARDTHDYYIELAARYDIDNNQWKGFIFISTDVNAFMKLCLPKIRDDEKLNIYKLLEQDKIEIDKKSIVKFEDYWAEKIKSKNKRGVYENPIRDFLYIFDKIAYY